MPSTSRAQRASPIRITPPTDPDNARILRAAILGSTDSIKVPIRANHRAPVKLKGPPQNSTKLQIYEVDEFFFVNPVNQHGHTKRSYRSQPTV